MALAALDLALPWQPRRGCRRAGHAGALALLLALLPSRVRRGWRRAAGVRGLYAAVTGSGIGCRA